MHVCGGTRHVLHCFKGQMRSQWMRVPGGNKANPASGFGVTNELAPWGLNNPTCWGFMVGIPLSSRVALRF